MNKDFDDWYKTEGIRYFSKYHGSADGHKDYMLYAWNAAVNNINKKIKCQYCGVSRDDVKDRAHSGGGMICHHCYKDYETEA